MSAAPSISIPNSPLPPSGDSNSSNIILNEIVSKLKDGLPGACQSVFSLSTSLERQVVSTDDFQRFLQDIHDLLITLDSAKRSSLFRVIRYCLQSAAYVKVLIHEDIHWLIVAALERESDYSMERIQALKIIDRIRVKAPDVFPIAFARSLVAISNSKEDNFRKVCLESLRELSIANPCLVAVVQGFTTLMDAVVDPVSQEVADNILRTILFLLNDPSTRKIVAPCVDLKMLLIPFTDLDTDPVEMAPRWLAAKAAFNVMMKTWVGVMYMTSDELALPMLIKMLKDPRVPTHIQDVILDSIIDVLEPVCSKVSYANRSRRYNPLLHADNTNNSPLPSSPSSSKLNLAHLDNRASRANSDSDMANNANSKLRKDSINSVSGSNLSALAGGSNNSRRPSASAIAALTKDDNPRASTKHFSLSAFFGGGGKSTTNLSSSTNPQNGGNNTTTRGSMSGPIPPNGNNYSGISQEQKNLLKRASINLSIQNNLFDNQPSQMGNSTGKLGAISETPSGPEVDESDPIFNLLDNYTALLACAFLHVDLVNSLFSLGVEGSISIAKKSRSLMVNFLQILASVLPESTCADLLTNPALIDLAATVDMKQSKLLHQCHKSSQLLIDLAQAFSIMPYKQTSGNHVSNLSAAIQATSSGRGRNGSITRSNTTTYNANNASSSSRDATLVASSQKSTFQSLNIQTIYELAEEIKISSSSTIFSQSQTAHKVLSQDVDILHSLQVSLTPSVDKTDFLKQMDASRINGKEGKEPFRWDWMVISDMLEYSFQHPDRLNEALKTKWIRRVSGFFRCTFEEKAYFANLEWEPTNLQYLECACNLYSVLLQDDANGMPFLTSDRRGMLMNQIAEELERLTVAASNVMYHNAASNMAVSNTTGSSKNVFRLQSCHCMMAREFFTLLGRIVRTPGSRKLLDHTHIFKYLTQLGQYPSLDYICRLVLTSLAFTDGGILSKHLLQLWSTQSNCSAELKQYLHLLLRVMLHTFGSLDHPNNHINGLNISHNAHSTSAASAINYKWYIDAIVSQLSFDDDPTETILKAVNEAVQNKASLRSIISKRPHISSHDILVRFLAVPEGIEYLQSKGWMDTALKEWQDVRCREYVSQVEDKLALALLSTANLYPTSTTNNKNGSSSRGVLPSTTSKKALYLHSAKAGNEDNNTKKSGVAMFEYLMRTVEPIPIKTPEIVKEFQARQGTTPPRSTSNTGTSTPTARSSTPTPQAPTHSQHHVNPNANLVVDLHGLMRMPWNIEVKLSATTASLNSTANNANMAGMGGLPQTAGEYLKIDTFLDASYMSSPLSFETTSDHNRIVKIRGLVLDSKGFPNGKVVSPSVTIAMALTAGFCPVFKTGRIMGSMDSRSLLNRRRSNTSAPGAVPGTPSNGGSGNTSNPLNASTRASYVQNSGNSNASGNLSTAANNSANNTGDGDDSNNANNLEDLPISYGQEHIYEWYNCRPNQRQGPQLVPESPDSNRFILAIPNEPVVLVFMRRPINNAATTAYNNNPNNPNNPLQRGSRSGSISKLVNTDTTFFDGGRPNSYVFAGANSSSASNRATALYLVEVQYFFRIETGYSIFVPMPRHFYGELSRTLEGCAYLAQRNIVYDLVTKVRLTYENLVKGFSASNQQSNTLNAALGGSPPSPPHPSVANTNVSANVGSNTIELRSLLWSLAHIGASDLGYNALSNVDPNFVEWCIEGVCSCPYFSVRATYFHVLGLLSRSVAGGRKLTQCRWDYAFDGSNSAVAIPRHAAMLFRKSNIFQTSVLPTPSANAIVASTIEQKAKGLGRLMAGNNTPTVPLPYMNPQYVHMPASIHSLTPFVFTDLLSMEQEVLNIVCKMPGVILYRDCKAKLENIKREHPEVFSKRSLYLEVLRVLESYTFKLTARREVIAFFSEDAKRKSPAVIPANIHEMNNLHTAVSTPSTSLP